MTTNPLPQRPSPPAIIAARFARHRTRWKASPRTEWSCRRARRTANGMLPKVSLDGISLSYKTNDGSQLLALDNINLKVKAGEFLCIVGPSGCGKSTLLHLIAGLQQATSGRVLVDDKPVEGPGTDRILIFQELGLFPWLTVRTKRRVRHEDERRFQSRAEGEDRSTTCGWFTWRSSRTATPTSSPGECGSGWRWPGRWPRSRMCC